MHKKKTGEANKLMSILGASIEQTIKENPDVYEKEEGNGESPPPGEEVVEIPDSTSKPKLMFTESSIHQNEEEVDVDRDDNILDNSNNSDNIENITELSIKKLDDISLSGDFGSIAIVDGNDKDFKSDRLMEEENISAIIMNNADADMGFNPSLIKSNNDEKVLVGKDEVIQIGPAEDLYVFESDHEDQEDELEKSEEQPRNEEMELEIAKEKLNNQKKQAKAGVKGYVVGSNEIIFEHSDDEDEESIIESNRIKQRSHQPEEHSEQEEIIAQNSENSEKVNENEGEEGEEFHSDSSFAMNYKEEKNQNVEVEEEIMFMDINKMLNRDEDDFVYKEAEEPKKIDNVIDEELGIHKENIKIDSRKEKEEIMKKEISESSTKIAQGKYKLREATSGPQVMNNLSRKAEILKYQKEDKTEDNTLGGEQDLDRGFIEDESEKSEKSSSQEYEYEIKEETKGEVYQDTEEIKDSIQDLMDVNDEEEDKWDNVTKQNDEILQNYERKTQFGFNITYETAYEHLSSLDLSKEKSTIKRTDYTHLNPFKKLFLQCTGKLKLDTSLTEERDILLSLMKTKLILSDNCHYSMLYSIYKHLTGSGNIHWEKIGFQNANPVSDVRGAGMLGVLQSLYFAENYKGVAAEYYNTSRDENYNYPFICTLFQFTALSAECLREGRITNISNKLRSVEKAFNDLYAGAFIIFMDNWIKDRSTIADYGAKFSTMKKYVKQNINTVLMKAQTTLVEKRNTDINNVNNVNKEKKEDLDVNNMDAENVKSKEILKPSKEGKDLDGIEFDSINQGKKKAIECSPQGKANRYQVE